MSEIRSIESIRDDAKLKSEYLTGKKLGCFKSNTAETNEDILYLLSILDLHIEGRDKFHRDTIEKCAILAETLKEDRFGKLVNFQVADEIRKLKVTP